MKKKNLINYLKNNLTIKIISKLQEMRNQYKKKLMNIAILIYNKN